jgi:hypothetical protein
MVDMAEIVVKIPEKLDREIKAFPDIDWSGLIEEFVKVKTFELELKRSNKLRLLLIKSLTSKSKLSEEEADRFSIKLGNKIKDERFKELKASGLI